MTGELRTPRPDLGVANNRGFCARDLHHRLRGRYVQQLPRCQQQLATDGAREELDALADLVRSSGRKICLMCFEADHRHCHRSMVIDALSTLVTLQAVHLVPMVDEEQA